MKYKKEMVSEAVCKTYCRTRAVNGFGVYGCTDDSFKKSELGD